MNDCNSYIDFNNWISEIIADAKSGKNINLNKIIKKASRLPSPDTTEKYSNLIDSGLCYGLDELAFLLSNSLKPAASAIRTKTGKKDTKKSLTTYLSELWKIWEKYFLKYGWDNYVFHLIRSDKYLQKASAFKSYYHKITHPGDKCYNPACEIPHETVEYTEFYMKHSSEFLALSRASLLGCEGFVHACLWLKNALVFEKIWKYWKAPDISRIQLAWLPFIICAGELKRANILKDIWDSMKKNRNYNPEKGCKLS
jgi:hypothetical protein